MLILKVNIWFHWCRSGVSGENTTDDAGWQRPTLLWMRKYACASAHRTVSRAASDGRLFAQSTGHLKIYSRNKMHVSRSMDERSSRHLMAKPIFRKWLKTEKRYRPAVMLSKFIDQVLNDRQWAVQLELKCVLLCHCGFSISTAFISRGESRANVVPY